MSAFVPPAQKKFAPFAAVASGSTPGRVIMVLVLVTGMIILYAVVISPVVRGANSASSAEDSDAAAVKKNKDSLFKRAKDRFLSERKKKEAAAAAAKKKKKQQEEEEEEEERLGTPAPQNRAIDGVPQGRGHHFDEAHIRKMVDMVEYARKNHLPNPFPDVPPDKLEEHIRGHKEERIELPMPGNEKHPIRADLKEDKEGAKGLHDPMNDDENVVARDAEDRKHEENAGLNPRWGRQTIPPKKMEDDH